MGDDSVRENVTQDMPFWTRERGREGRKHTSWKIVTITIIIEEALVQPSQQSDHWLVECREFQYLSISSAVLPGILPAIRDHLFYFIIYI